MGVGPAALEAAAALPRDILRLKAETVLAGSVERGGRGRFPVRRIDVGVGFLEKDFSGASILAPPHRQLRTLVVRSVGIDDRVVRRPGGESRRLAHGRLPGGADGKGRTLLR